MPERFTPIDIGPVPEVDKPSHECAIVGVRSRKFPVAEIALEGLIELNHRGQEGAGVMVSNAVETAIEKGNGLATIVFNREKRLPHISNPVVALGQDRYTTSGNDNDTQPFQERSIGMAHNGNLTNINWLREEYGLPKIIDGAQSDSRAALSIINMMPGETPREKFLAAVKRFEGAFNMILSAGDTMFATRDPLGFRPLALGKLHDDGGFAVASENVAFERMGAEYIRDIIPGETIMVDDEGVKTIGMDQRAKLAQCIWELIYIGRPDSTIFGIPVTQFRHRQGRILARHLPDADVLMPVPKSGIASAEGVLNSPEFRESGMEYYTGLYTNAYRDADKGGRTFILPNGRDEAATMKYSPIEEIVRGKRVVLVDDTIVRGSMRKVVNKLRAHGAVEVHARIPSPPVKHGCYYGVDFGSGELIANSYPDLEERARALNLDSLYHFSYAELMEAALGNKVDDEVAEEVFENHDFCGACFTGRYPLDVSGVIPRTNNLYEE